MACIVEGTGVAADTAQVVVDTVAAGMVALRKEVGRHIAALALPVGVVLAWPKFLTLS